jgi:hypothetical protein
MRLSLAPPKSRVVAVVNWPYSLVARTS